MDCDICAAPSMPRSIYCRACGRRVLGQHEGHARAVAMKAAKRPDGFHCHYTDVLLNMKDSNDPWYGTFDHPVPGVKGELVFSGFVVNANKTNLTADEYPKLVRENVHHWDTGEPFNRNVVSFDCWKKQMALKLDARKAGGRRPLAVPKAGGTLEKLLVKHFGPVSAAARECMLCHQRIYSPAKYCNFCSRLVLNSHHGTAAERVETLVKGRHEDGSYHCYYTDVMLDLLDPTSPWSLAFDHLIPGMRGTMVPSSLIMNTRKTDMSDEEFRAFERQLDIKFLGGKFDPKAVKLEYWRRHS